MITKNVITKKTNLEKSFSLKNEYNGKNPKKKHGN